MKRRRMTALQRKYFGKKSKPRSRAVSRVRVKRRKAYMARRKGGFKGRRGLGGKMGMFAPILGGVADNIADSYIPMVDGVGSTAVGFLLKSEFCKNIGLYKVGYSVGNLLPIPRGAGNNVIQTGGLL